MDILVLPTLEILPSTSLTTKDLSNMFKIQLVDSIDCGSGEQDLNDCLVLSVYH